MTEVQIHTDTSHRNPTPAQNKPAEVPPIYATMKETYTTILRTNPSVRTPRSGRATLDSARSSGSRNAGPIIACRGCGEGSDKRHPCMFCQRCLTELKHNLQAEQSRGMKQSCSFDSDASDLTEWNKTMKGKRDGTPRKASKRQTSFQRGTGEVVLNSSLSFQDDFPPSPRQPRELSPHEKRYKTVWNKATKNFEQTHSFCGFCGINNNRSAAKVVYCMHCRKHLCKEHERFHKQVKIFRPHALINLQTGANKGLL